MKHLDKGNTGAFHCGALDGVTLGSVVLKMAASLVFDDNHRQAAPVDDQKVTPLGIDCPEGIVILDLQDFTKRHLGEQTTLIALFPNPSLKPAIKPIFAKVHKWLGMEFLPRHSCGMVVVISFSFPGGSGRQPDQNDDDNANDEKLNQRYWSLLLKEYKSPKFRSCQLEISRRFTLSKYY